MPGERAANLLTIIGSAIHNDLDVRAYLDDALRQALAGETNWPARRTGQRRLPTRGKQSIPNQFASIEPTSVAKPPSRQAADRKRKRKRKRKRRARRLLNKSTGRR